MNSQRNQWEILVDGLDRGWLQATRKQPRCWQGALKKFVDFHKENGRNWTIFRIYILFSFPFSFHFSSFLFFSSLPSLLRYRFYKKLKNVSCEYYHVNGWNSTLQAAWYIRYLHKLSFALDIDLDIVCFILSFSCGYYAVSSVSVSAATRLQAYDMYVYTLISPFYSLVWGTRFVWVIDSTLAMS